MAKPTIVTRAGKGSALTWTEGDANLTNLRDATITVKAGTGGTDVVNDLNGTVTLVAGTNVTLSGNNTTKEITINASGGSGITDVVQDTTPQLGGNLDTNGYDITTSYTSGPMTITGNTDKNIAIRSQGTGNVVLLPLGTGQVTIDGLNWPTADGTSNQVLKTDGAGNLSWTTPSSGMTSFTAAADSGTSQTIENGNTLTIAGGTGLSSVASATDTITINLDNTAVTPASYTLTNLTVDAQGRITAASSASTTGSGNVVLATSPTLVTPILGTPTSGTLTNCTGLPVSGITASTTTALGVGSLEVGHATDTTLSRASAGRLAVEGVNIVTVSSTDTLTNKTLTSPVISSITNTGTLTLPTATGTLGYRNLPAVGTQTGSYTLTTADVGRYVQVGSGGSITIPNSTFAEGDVVLIANNHTAAITITCSITDAYIAGTDTDKATVSLATRGIASIVFLSGTRCIITGNVS